MDEPSNYNSTEPSRGNYGEDGFATRVLEAAIIFDKYYTPILFLFGTLGNSLSLVVFCMNTKYRSQSASYYLSALAISDTGFLVNLLAVWLESVLGGVITSGIMCPLVMYLGQVTCFMSVYLTVAFSVERFIAVHYPLSRPRICTRSKARKIIAALTAIALLVFSYVLVIAQVIELPSRREDYYELYRDIDGDTSSIFNSSLEQSSELFPFPDDRKQGKKESMIQQSGTSISSMQLLRSFELPQNTTTTKLTQRLLRDAYTNCDDDARYMTTLDKSISPRNRNVSQNCSDSYGKILRGFEHFASGESSEESYSTSLESSFEAERDGGEQYAYPGVYICSVPQDYHRISEIAIYLDSIVTLIIPFFLITFFNVRIAICVWKLKDQRQNIVAASTTGNINHHHSSSVRNKQKPQQQQSSNSLVGGCKRQHSTQKIKLRESCKEIIAGGDDSVNEVFGEIASESRLSNNRNRQETTRTIRFATPDQTNNASSSEGGSEENSEADNCRYGDGNSYDCIDECGGSGGGTNPGLSRSGSKMKTLTATSNSTSIGRFASCLASITKMRGKRETRHTQSPSTGQTMKPELVLVRERGSTNHPSSNASEVRVTKTLLLVSTVFLVLNLPAHAIRCAQFIQSLRGTSEGQVSAAILQAAQTWTNILFNTNFAVNFLLYCVSGRNFRKSLRNIILRKFNRKSSNIWKQTKKGRKEYYNPTPSTSAKFGTKRNFTTELHVTEIVELEDRGEDFVYRSGSNRNGRTVNFNDVDEDDETM